MVVGIVTDSYQILMPRISLIRDCRSRYADLSSAAAVAVHL